MNETPRCDDTTNGSTRSSSHRGVTGKPRKGDKSSTPKQSGSKERGLLAGMFSLEDLHRLTFHPTDEEPEVDVWSATPLQFQTFVQQFADVENVNTALWPLGERLYFINHVWDICQETEDTFPFTVGKMLSNRAANEE